MDNIHNNLVKLGVEKDAIPGMLGYTRCGNTSQSQDTKPAYILTLFTQSGNLM